MSEPEKKDNEENSSKTFGDFVLKFLEDRASDPLWRSYLLFFVIYNWKAFGALILGKAEDPSMRISLATNYFMYNESNIPLFGYILKHIIPYEMHFFIVPFVYSLLFIFVYLKHIKPKIVEIYSKNNGLSLESVKKQLKEKDDEINKLNKEKDDLKKEKVNNIKYNI